MAMNHGYFKNHDDPGTLNGSFEAWVLQKQSSI